MLDFDTPVGIKAAVAPVQVKAEVAVSEEVVVQARPNEMMTFASRPDGEWGWEEVRDYVVTEIEKRFGTFPRHSNKEYGIFSGFVSRWGDQAAAIARHAFEVQDGRWKGSPISVTRFCRNSDPYFASVIAERLVAEPTTEGW